jgi:hypothetical protein
MKKRIIVKSISFLGEDVDQTEGKCGHWFMLIGGVYNGCYSTPRRSIVNFGDYPECVSCLTNICSDIKSNKYKRVAP